MALALVGFPPLLVCYRCTRSRVFERAPDIRTTGAGFNLWPNAGRAIHGLGLREQYEDISVNLDRYIELDTEGVELFRPIRAAGLKPMAPPRSGSFVQNWHECLVTLLAWTI